jgi:hypothetical protein
MLWWDRLASNEPISPYHDTVPRGESQILGTCFREVFLPAPFARDPRTGPTSALSTLNCGVRHFGSGGFQPPVYGRKMLPLRGWPINFLRWTRHLWFAVVSHCLADSLSAWQDLRCHRAGAERFSGIVGSMSLAWRPVVGRPICVWLVPLLGFSSHCDGTFTSN